jgi:hypothetical protein
MAEIDWDKFKENVSSLITWTYWIVGTVIAFAISYVLYTRFNKQVASLLVFMGTMMAMYYYYVKWFVIGQPLPIPAQTCPDFMESIGTYKDTDQLICVDKKGAYPYFGPGSDAKKENIDNKETSTNGGAVNSITGYVITPSPTKLSDTKAIGTFCNALKESNISWINLCNYS